jgi:hypothetical protein
MLPLIDLLLPTLRRLLVIFRCFSPMPPLVSPLSSAFSAFAAVHYCRRDINTPPLSPIRFSADIDADIFIFAIS